ncbi:MAG: hypothetical protein KGJ31_01490 [Patescibacteria group bacterium]|nr:hypothetical protein [Patescibacteria group bacterium]
MNATLIEQLNKNGLNPREQSPSMAANRQTQKTRYQGVSDVIGGNSYRGRKAFLVAGFVLPAHQITHYLPLRMANKASPKDLMVCTNCGHVGSPKKEIPGSIWITLILLCFYILPGIIYEIWRNNGTKKICTLCGSANLVPIDSPNAIKILESQGETPASVKANLPEQENESSFSEMFPSMKKLQEKMTTKD